MEAEHGIWGPSEGRTGLVGQKVVLSHDFGNVLGQKELWNVANFIDSYQDETGALSPCTTPMVDSGIGLDRTSGFLAGVSIQGIDQYRSALDAIESTLSIESKQDTYVVLDHLKTAALIIQNGIMPGPKGRESVVRKLLRRTAVIAIRQEIDYQKIVPLLGTIVIDETDALPYDSLTAAEVQQVIREEMQRLKPVMKQYATLETDVQNRKDLSALYLFKLHTSAGLPLELIRDTYKIHGIPFPYQEFETLVNQHRKNSKSLS